MSVTHGGAVRAINTTTGAGNEAKTVVLASDVAAGATIILGILNRTDETTTLTSVADPVNGTWDGSTLRQGPTDNSGSTFRTWYVALTNSLALTGASNRTITVTLSAGVSVQFVAQWSSSSLGVLTFQAMATVLNQGTNTTTHTSNTIAASGAGSLVGFLALNAAQASAPTGDASPLETNQTTGSDAGSWRTNLFTEDFASASTYGLIATVPTTSTSQYHVGAFLEPAAGGSNANLFVGKFGALLRGKL